MKVSAVPGGMDREQTEQTGSRAVSENMTHRLLLGISSVVHAWAARLSGSCSPGIVVHPFCPTYTLRCHVALFLQDHEQGHELLGPALNRAASTHMTAVVTLSSSSVHGSSD
jgi:hypothetical protein